MNRTACLAALALILAYGLPPAVAFREAGGFGGGNIEGEGPIERKVRLEMEGGQKLEGTVYFQPLVVESDLGQYTIRPDKIKMIQFLRRANVEEAAAAAAEEPRNPQANAMMGRMRGGPGRLGNLVRGKVVTTSNNVIIGDIRIPANFALELEFGRLTPAPDKLRVLTMIDDEAPAAPEAKPDAPEPKAGQGRPNAPTAGQADRPGSKDSGRRKP